MAVTIYKIKSDYTGPELTPTDSNFWADRSMFKLQRLRPDWKKPTFYMHNPVQAKETDFYTVYIGILAFGKRVYEGSLGEILESCGEVLPAVSEDTREEFYIHNPLVCYNCLNHERTKLRTTPDGKVVVQIYEYAFLLERMGGESVFRIPETHRTELLVCNGLVDPASDFFHQYHEGGYTGLKFEKIWTEC
jgi:hypothetical protein